MPRGVTEKATLILSQQTPAMAQTLEYERSAFGHGWDDTDGDCQDSRAEALIATSTTPVRFATDKRCRVVTGRWVSSFTNQVIQNASDIDIDHVVPLAWSWGRGATQWSSEKRERFANDPVNLWPVEASLNRSKGAKGPNEWLPPAGHCGYVARFYRIVKIYKLEPRLAENEWIRVFLNDCRS
ncbi:HNH endonuclease family protein [Marinobacter sp. 2_MG-2023]|uniref:HNH endonuclease family protein n=1 Tax=Marinobacter sp. 2_MG-2023 TaxID=3062679 RepID=UPI0026E1283F|nr:HNH endonuclease family protein [Marinobacter sp. 2_MG-2023]MDO6441561.1 HNH endonuclease family protein [Marinobacter sp. 2_MG-2023]